MKNLLLFEMIMYFSKNLYVEEKSNKITRNNQHI